MTQACIKAIVMLGLNCPTPIFINNSTKPLVIEDVEIISRLRNNTICIHKYKDAPKCITKIIKWDKLTYHFSCGEPRETP